MSIPDLETYLPKVISWRRDLHMHPELGLQEVRTSNLIADLLTKFGLDVQRNFAGTAVLGTLHTNKPGKTVVLRADMDALPIQDAKDVPYRSQISGVCHACGHDAHMAMLLGTMRILVQNKEELPGTVYCCFEEGEETNCGIDTMIEALEKYPIDECFAFHVYNELDAGKVNIVPGPRMAGTVGIGFHLKGKSGHGSRPDQAINPIIPAAHIITQLNSAFMNQLNVEETVTLGLGMVKAGEATNIIPDDAYVGGTARFFNKEEGEKALEIIERIARNTADSYRCGIEFEKRNNISPYPVVNDEKTALKIQKAVGEICGEEVLGDCDKWFASECYSAYQNKYPGVLGFLGIRNEAYGSGAAHHNGKFDIDESGFWLGVCAEAAFAFEK